MKKLLLFITFSALINAQSNFSKGFDDGFKEGYCQDKGVGCVAPIAPVPPIPTTSENLNSYKDGYNRGFRTGISASKNVTTAESRKRYTTAEGQFIDNKMYDSSNLIGLKLQAIQMLVDKAMISYENEDYNETIRIANDIQKIESNAVVAYTLKSSSYLNMGQVLNAYNNGVKAYRINEVKTEGLYNKITQEMNDYLINLMADSNYIAVKVTCENFWVSNNISNYFLGLAYYYQNDEKQAKKFLKKVKNYEPAEKYLSAIESKIRIKNPYTSQSNNVSSNKPLVKKATVKDSPIINKPTSGQGEEVIGLAKNDEVYIIEKAGDYYFKVKSGNLEGYIWIGWLK